MGQTLSSPMTTKRSESGGNDRFAFGVSEMQGWRVGMEDAHATRLHLDEDNRTKNAFFAVYDGHGGAGVAKYAGKHVHKRLVGEQSYKEGRYQDSLRKTFLGTDGDILKDPEFVGDPSGCMAVAALITEDDRIFVANAGDSRCVLGAKGVSKPLSFDHKPTNEVEMTRIFRAGGYVDFGRVNGNLALARALGDFQYKRNTNVPAEDQIVTANPEIIEHKITKDDEFLVIACDGIWDCLTSQQCVDAVRLLISQGKELPEIAEMICELCLAPDVGSGAGRGCDNMTIVIIALFNGRTEDQWRKWVSDRVKNRVGRVTPEALPQLYSESRLMAFKAKRAVETRERDNQARLGEALRFLGSSLTQVLGSTGGIFLDSGSRVASVPLMFAHGNTKSGLNDQPPFDHASKNYNSNSTGLTSKEQLGTLGQHSSGKTESGDDVEMDTDPTSPSPGSKFLHEPLHTSENPLDVVRAFPTM